MNIAGFFADVASAFRDRYLDLTKDMQAHRTPNHFTGTKTTPEASQPPVAAEPVDTYEPSTTTDQPVADSKDKPAESDSENKPVTETPAHTTPVEQKPDGTYYRRSAKLKYKLDLEFNLAAMTQTVERLAEGDVKAVEEFAAAGFGFNAGFDIKGSQTIKTNADVSTDERSKSKSVGKARARSTSQFAAQTKNFAVESFHKEATDVRKSMSEKVKDGHRRTTNKFSLRFRMDNQFSMAFGQKFNVQTKQVAEQAPDAIGQYVETAGQVAEKGSSEMMATFFDAVDSYLGDTEQAVKDKVTAFFDEAAAELGFSGAEVQAARDHLTGTIERFFDRVEVAVSGMESKFVAQPPVEPVAPVEMDPSLYAPAMAQDQYDVAVA